MSGQIIIEIKNASITENASPTPSPRYATCHIDGRQFASGNGSEPLQHHSVQRLDRILPHEEVVDDEPGSSAGGGASGVALVRKIAALV